MYCIYSLQYNMESLATSSMSSCKRAQTSNEKFLQKETVMRAITKGQKQATDLNDNAITSLMCFTKYNKDASSLCWMSLT